MHAKRQIFIRLDLLRDHLKKEMQFDRSMPFAYDFERAVDDWVCL